ncbi:MAG: aldo/keto reductase [Armatimonadaceae bacterium]
MQFTKLGNTGLDISLICLGCMGFGDSNRPPHQWVLNEFDTHAVIRHALDKGINFFDTANVYAAGTSEEYVGRALADMANRDSVVIATKVFSRMHDGPNGAGLSRKAILAELDNSLRRLGTDYIDLYQTHRWDHHTPIEETMAALDTAVRSGKVRYIGASAMYAWQFQKALYTSERNGFARFVCMQNHLNLIYREEEREMLPLCIDQKIGLIPYSPLAGGRLSRAWNPDSSDRAKLDSFAKTKYDHMLEADKPILDTQGMVAEQLGVSRTEVALAWLLAKQPVDAPIVGATRNDHIDTAIAALDVRLSPEQIADLERHYVPHPVIGAL